MRDSRATETILFICWTILLPPLARSYAAYIIHFLYFHFSLFTEPCSNCLKRKWKKKQAEKNTRAPAKNNCDFFTKSQPQFSNRKIPAHHKRNNRDNRKGRVGKVSSGAGQGRGGQERKGAWPSPLALWLGDKCLAHTAHPRGEKACQICSLDFRLQELANL